MFLVRPFESLGMLGSCFPDKGTAKIARRLGIEFAEAVVRVFPLLSKCETDFRQTGFEFKKRRATPIVEGVVIAKENEQWLLDVSLVFIMFPLANDLCRRSGKRNKTHKRKPA